MTWANILAGLVKVAGLVGEFLRNRQLMEAGRADQKSKYTQEQLDRVKRANSAPPSDGELERVRKKYRRD